MGKEILWFKELRKESIGLVGGKGANLGEMAAAGFSIPQGFCVTAQAYEEFLQKEELDELITDILADLDADNTQELQNASEEIHNLIINAPFPGSLREQLLSAYGQIGGYVAVRSSATAEDLPEASFAGQQSTFLNINGDEALLDAVKRCWASLYTARAISYRQHHDFKHEDVLIAVVVQEMIDSEAAGVMFTVNPVTKDEDEMIIESSYGLGELVVAGQVTPDSIIVTKEPAIKQKHLGSKKQALYLDKERGENVEREVPEEEQEQFSISDDQVLKIAEEGIRIEEHYGKPQDVEWAMMDDELYILQSRPITTL